MPDVTIVSGLAYGVDIHAHRAALANGLPTYAVLAHGLDRIYPSLHRDTAKEMVSQGGLLTEYFSGTVPDKGNFVRRNRIMAGIAEATLVIESADRGGSLITATIASSYGREVMAVPGRVGDPYSAGCNQLIQRNQASLVTSAADLVKLLNWPTESAKAQPSEPQLFPLYTAEQERVVDVLAGNDGLSMDALALQTGFTVAQLADLLFDLEEMGSVKRMPGNRYRVKG
ncbi:smf protein DNA processing chain A [gut metagenome]|uniref:Smf protein DNA processing chain A n=1 Tax=gut metagenome TaxID=749906 RepID=J9GP22_9ZZZZ